MQENSEKTFVWKKEIEKPKNIGFFSSSFIFVFGFLLPFIALSVELTTKMCAGAIFDPLPTIWHAVLIGFVPLSSIVSLYAIRKNNYTHLNKLLMLNGIALAVSIFYSIIFIPVIPIGVIAILFLGLGLLPLSPLLSMIASFKVNKYLLKMNKTNSKSLLIGAFLGVSGLVYLELPVTLTRYGMELATSTNKSTELQGVRILRTFGNKDVMLRYCYVTRGQAPDLISMLIESRSTMTPGKARDIYYKVTGKTFNTVPPPNALMSRLQINDEFIFDEDQAGDTVGGHLKNLSLASSRMDGIIDQKSGSAYTEWVMSFKNTANFQQEARTEIKLPEGGVVSRLTLWVNGQEREAAFAGKEQVRFAYKKVVERKRDPVLVTSEGAGRVMMQCFPVPPNGEMKVRLGITYPLQFINKKQAMLSMPYTIGRNFNIDDNFNHYVWIDSKNPIYSQGNNFEFSHIKNTYSLQGRLNNKVLEDNHSPIKLLTSLSDNSWSEDLDKKYIITQKVKESIITKPERAVIVIDGSLAMKNSADEIYQSLKALDKSIETKIVIASDNLIELKNREDLKNISFVGGHNNNDALMKSFQLAYEKDNSAIVWLHGPQPAPEYSYEVPLEEIDRYLSKGKNNVRFYESQIGAGENVLIKELGQMMDLKPLPANDNLKVSLTDLFSSWNGSTKELTFVREKVLKSATKDLNETNKASSHLTRLWAYSNVINSIKNNKSGDAVKVAGNYQLVTPVSGAVVLENNQQYDEAGLKPVNSSSVPIIPEPEEWLLMISALVILLWFIKRGKRECYTA